MPQQTDLDDFRWVTERLLLRAQRHSKVWIGVWLASVLAVTSIVATFGAPLGAYLVLLLVAVLAVGVDGTPQDHTPQDPE